MSSVIKTLLSLSLSGSLLMGLLALLRPVYRGRTSLRWQYYIWLAVVLRMLLPIAPEANLMEAVLGEQAASVTQQQSGSAPSQGEWSWAVKDPVEQGEASSSRPSPEIHPPVSEEISGGEKTQSQSSPSSPGPMDFALSWLWRQRMALLTILWLGGAAALLGKKAVLYRRFVRQLKAASTPVTDPALLALSEEIHRKMRLKKSIGLVVSSGVSSPMLLGLLHPCVVLPQLHQRDHDLLYTLLHELTHYKRRDLAYRWLVQLVLCFHWFNPLVRWMDREVSRLCELSCDEAVLRLLDASERRAYGDTLLRAAALSNGLDRSIPSLSLSRGGQLLRERLGAILHYQEASRRFAAAAITLTVFISFSGLFLGACPLPSSEEPHEESPPAVVIPQEDTLPSPEETEKESPAAHVPLPQVTGPDEEGNFPPIDEKDFEAYVTNGPGDTAKPDPEEIPSFLDHPLGQRWLSEHYPSVTDWEILYEGKDFALTPEMYDPYRYQWRDQWVPCYAVVLATSQGNDFDRLLLLAREDISVICGDDSYLPRLELYVSAYAGWESDWLLGDGSGLEAVFSQNSGHSPVLWIPEEGRGLLTAQDNICLPVTGLTQPPSQIFFSYPLSSYITPPAGHEEDVLLLLGGHMDYAIGLYESESKQVTLPEPQRGAWQLFSLDGQTLAIMDDTAVTLYGFSSEDLLRPIAQLEGNGGVLGEDEVFIFYQIATLRGHGGSHVILYYRQQERMWRVCTFDTDGNILSDFSTGLPVVEDYLDGLAFEDGLVYFAYFREGTDKADSLERYCIDARPGREHLLQQIG